MRTFFLFAAFVTSSLVYAKGFLRGSAMYLSQTDGGQNSTRMMIDVNAGYLREKGWAFAGLYQKDARSGSTSVTTTSYGPGLGWFTRKEFGFYVLGTYFLKSSRDDGYAGQGYQIDLGYRFELRRISYGMQISYKHFGYDTINGAKVASYSVGRIDPYFTAWFEF